MGTITILPETTKNPITLMGQRAGVCWGGNIEDPAKNYKRGMDCIISGHGICKCRNDHFRLFSKSRA